jgi:hypothetical protein
MRHQPPKSPEPPRLAPLFPDKSGFTSRVGGGSALVFKRRFAKICVTHL